ncbi:alpha-amylase family glycosyl hydrolase [Dyadobacter psychrotolerans]|uniref:1,4-alpha-glucan branching enzyme n=1 Tax=Dyadobacter psychrotolerans TaxID=2541721 RepID=A0A4R5DTC5_9BACT|nr:alpha-amylase family glycosyl hydrolase [Dyadobacter psychrotolerans]TDE15654.1 1,4-alpha-glucan branching protein [Dyadobacter psychrotolerans]
MPASQQHITPSTPMGANLLHDGATFRVWAPRAKQVYVSGGFNNWEHDDSTLLIQNNDGHWTGFMAGLEDGETYKFYVIGQGTEGFKRDPYARELTIEWPNPSCILRSASSFPWQDGNWKTPVFSDLIIYQFHIGTWYGPNRETRVAKFLDVLDRIEYLSELGVNAIEPLPIVEYSTPRSMGYNGSDLFSPEMDYQVTDDSELDGYLELANRLLTRKGKPPLTKQILAIGINQFKALVDICHHYGIAVILDVVYNHASGDVTGQSESIYFFDRAAGADKNDSLYFTNEDHTGPVFAFWNESVRQFLIDNARFFLDEYHIDGYRYDQVTVIDKQNVPSGWLFCQHLNSTLAAQEPEAINIAEYWGPDPAVVRTQQQGGAGFHANWHDGLRNAIRGVISQASGGQNAHIDWQPVANQLIVPGFADTWRAVQYVESHDEVYRDRAPRIPSLAVGGGDTRSWYATSRSRVATGLILTSPGIPMLFMGQEFFEDKRWADDAPNHKDMLIFWKGLDDQKIMIDFLRFTRELIWIRRKHPGLRGERVKALSMENSSRVLVFQRWVERTGRDVIVVVSLNENTLYNYQIPLPASGKWFEVFNSDVYENWVNPASAGNGGSIEAIGGPMNGLSASALITVPANSIVIFSRDLGD